MGEPGDFYPDTVTNQTPLTEVVAERAHPGHITTVKGREGGQRGKFESGFSRHTVADVHLKRKFIMACPAASSALALLSV